MYMHTLITYSISCMIYKCSDVFYILQGCSRRLETYVLVPPVSCGAFLSQENDPYILMCIYMYTYIHIYTYIYTYIYIYVYLFCHHALI
jgi:hypothetical protein